MEIKGKVHCMFEQSGTFKREFRKLGYEAYDYDIQNEFEETDFRVDLFNEIHKAWNPSPDGTRTVFDGICGDDLIIAFFPCIYFSALQATDYTPYSVHYKNLGEVEVTERILKRIRQRSLFHQTVWELLGVAYKRRLRLVIENPATPPHYLIQGQNFIKPSFIDKDRTLRGDWYKKPTAWWFVNCTPEHGESYQINRHPKRVNDAKRGKGGGICSTERSAISPDYARNFICDFILGRVQPGISQPELDF